MIHPECEHDCTSNCRREGCECLCGEYHDSYEPEEEVVEQCFCPSYFDDENTLKDCKCGKCK